MPDRYTLIDTGELRDRFALPKGVPAGVKKHYNISPMQTIPVVIVRNGERVMERMKWGFIPKNAKDTHSVFRYKTHHARSEVVFRGPTWQGAIRTQRCLVPANGFYEWRKSPDGKHAFYIHPTDQSLFAFAGIYGEWTDPDGITHGMCAIITTASGSETDQVPSRLPVILDPADEAAWLDPELGDVSTLLKIMRPYAFENLKITRVSDAVNAKKANDLSLITPLAVCK
jgi:putative SOS response-associated peptidase YedK